MPNLTTIPEWVAPLAPPPDLDKQGDYEEIIATWLAENAPIPLVFGEGMVGGRVFAADYEYPVGSPQTGQWTIGVLWCVGTGGTVGIDSIQNVYINGAAPVAGVTTDDYLGTSTQTANSKLQTAIGGYADTLVVSTPQGDFGIAYTVFQYTDVHYPSPPQFHAKIRGLKVDGGSYSNNPAKCLKWLITDSIHGLGETADATSFATVATDNDATVVAEARRTIGLTMAEPNLTMDHIKILATYASCWAFKQGDTWYAVSDRSRSSDETITTARTVRGSLSLDIASRDNVPTVVEVQYTDTSETIWRTRTAIAELAGVSVGTTPRRVSRVRMPGVTRYSQAMREAEERLAKLNKIVTLRYTGPDNDLKRQIGDVITITHPNGLSSKAFRINAPPIYRGDPAGGVSVQLEGIEYDSSVYNDSEESTPTFGANGDVLGPGTPAGSGGGTGASGVPGLPGSATLLLYDDMETTTVPNGDGKYSLLTTLGTNTSGTNTNTGLEAAVGLIIDDTDRNGTSQSDYLATIVVGDTFAFWISDQRWYHYRVTSIETPPAGTYKFGCSFIISDTTDGTGNVSLSAGLDVSHRFSRGATGAEGRPGLPAAGSVFTYDDLETDAGVLSAGQYIFSTNATTKVGTSTWSTIRSSSILSIWIDPLDASSTDHTTLWNTVDAGDVLVWWDSDRRWVAYRVTSNTISDGDFRFQVDYLYHDEADGSGNPPLTTDSIQWRLSRPPTGVDGADGAAGAAGANGTNGTNGTDGVDGQQLGIRETFQGQTIGQIQTRWNNEIDIGGEESVYTDTGSPVGTKVWRMGNTSGNDEVSRAMDFDFRIPVILDQLYQVTFIFSREGGTGTAYCGVAGIADDGVTRVNISGADSWSSQHYFAAKAELQTADGDYKTYKAYFVRNGDTATDSNAGTVLDPHKLHVNAHFVVPLFYFNFNDADGTHHLAYAEVAPVDNEGAIAGNNIFNEAGTVLDGIDLENDALVGQQLGNSLWANPGFSQAMRYRGTPPTTIGRPAHWFVRGGAENKITYVDSTRDSIDIVGSLVMVSEAIPVQPSRTIRILLRARSDNTATIAVRAMWHTSADIGNNQAIMNIAGSTYTDPEILLSTGSSAAFDGAVTDIVLTGTKTVYELEWTPGATAKVMSFYLAADGAEHIELDWCYATDLATRNTGAMADEDEVTAPFVQTGSLYRVSKGGGYESGLTSFKGPSTWVEVVTCDLVAPATITNIRVRAQFNGIVAMGYTTSSTSITAWGIQWRILDHDDVVIEQGIWEVSGIPSPTTAPTQKLGYGAHNFDVIFDNTYLNASTTNTFKVELYTANTLTTAWSKYENFTLVMYDAAGDDS